MLPGLQSMHSKSSAYSASRQVEYAVICCKTRQYTGERHSSSVPWYHALLVAASPHCAGKGSLTHLLREIMHRQSIFKESQRQTKGSQRKAMRKKKETTTKWEKALQPSRKHSCFSDHAGPNQIIGGITVA